MTTFKLPAEAKKEIRAIYHSERDAYVHQYIQRHLREREELIEVHPVSLVRLQDLSSQAIESLTYVIRRFLSLVVQ